MKMREIEFRGKTTKGQWLYGDFRHGFSDESPSGYITQDRKYVIVKKETIGQYTGLKDKNGVKIYEGDVIDAKHSIIEVQSVVKFDEKKAVFCMWGSSDWTPLYEWTDFKVVGNIFDDELLKRRWEWIYFHEPTGPIEGETRITMTISDPESIKRLCEILKDK